ncbi:MAG: ATP-binding cassette domain-containing protein [Pseudomonadota bacterium]
MLSLERVCARRGKVEVLHDITLSVPAGKTLAVVGESGAGKSTLLACILGLLAPSSGTITWAGAPVRAARPALVMQEPRSAFNPVRALRHSVSEPLIAQGKDVPRDRLERLCAGLELPFELLSRRPGEVSIGQAQRAGILRALIAAPPLILFDEPLSALDAATQKHTARLITDLQAEEGFAALIVTHDLGYACAHSDDLAVLRAGRVEEVAAPGDFVAGPRTDYGRKLQEAAFSLGALERVP